jgi:hypothetical protein
MRRTAWMRAAIIVVLAACSGVIQGGHTSAAFPGNLASVPRVGVKIDHSAPLPWLKARGDKVKAALEKCLPPVLDRLCGKDGCTYVFNPDDPEAERQKNMLKVTIHYERSAHFMDGFSIIALYEMKDPAGIETILKYKYAWEPKTKVSAGEGMDRDEAFTPQAADTAAAFCRDLGEELENVKPAGGP